MVPEIFLICPKNNEDIKEIKELNSEIKPIVIKESIREVFERVYRETYGKRKNYINSELIKALSPYFDDEETLNEYIRVNLERKKNNYIARYVRLRRKVYMAHFNYFATITFDDSKMD